MIFSTFCDSGRIYLNVCRFLRNLLALAAEHLWTFISFWEIFEHNISLYILICFCACGSNICVFTFFEKYQKTYFSVQSGLFWRLRQNICDLLLIFEIPENSNVFFKFRFVLALAAEYMRCFLIPWEIHENYHASENPNLVKSITGYKSSGPTERGKAQYNRTGCKSSGPTESGKHDTIEQAIKVAGPQREICLPIVLVIVSSIGYGVGAVYIYMLAYRTRHLL